jgi:galactoside O-acetyltransferase
MKTSFYSSEELKDLGLKSVGDNVLISRKVSIYSPETISIGNNVRIDDFCILSGDITIGSYIHISAYCALYGSNGIKMQNYTGMSMRCTILSATDDFSGDYLIGPIYPKQLTNVTGGPVVFSQYSQLGANTIVMPNIVIGEGAVTGAMTFVNRDLEEWTINAGIPVSKVRTRKKEILKMTNLF